MPDQPRFSSAGVHLIFADPWSKEWGQAQIERMLQDISKTYWGNQAIHYAEDTGWNVRYGDPVAGAAFTRPWPWKDMVLSRGKSYLATRGNLTHELMHVWLYKGALDDSIEQEYNCDFYTYVILMNLGSLPKK